MNSFQDFYCTCVVSLALRRQGRNSIALIGKNGRSRTLISGKTNRFCPAPPVLLLTGTLLVIVGGIFVLFCGALFGWTVTVVVLVVVLVMTVVFVVVFFITEIKIKLVIG